LNKLSLLVLIYGHLMYNVSEVILFQLHSFLLTCNYFYLAKKNTKVKIILSTFISYGVVCVSLNIFLLNNK